MRLPLYLDFPYSCELNIHNRSQQFHLLRNAAFMQRTAAVHMRHCRIGERALAVVG